LKHEQDRTLIHQAKSTIMKEISSNRDSALIDPSISKRNQDKSTREKISQRGHKFQLGEPLIMGETYENEIQMISIYKKCLKHSFSL